MKKVNLIAVSLEDLDGEPPRAGFEVVLGGVRYQVLRATPVPERRRGRTMRRGRSQALDEPARWKLLVVGVSSGD